MTLVLSPEDRPRFGSALRGVVDAIGLPRVRVIARDHGLLGAALKTADAAAIKQHLRSVDQVVQLFGDTLAERASTHRALAALSRAALEATRSDTLDHRAATMFTRGRTAHGEGDWEQLQRCTDNLARFRREAPHVLLDHAEILLALLMRDPTRLVEALRVGRATAPSAASRTAAPLLEPPAALDPVPEGSPAPADDPIAVLPAPPPTPPEVPAGSVALHEHLLERLARVRQLLAAPPDAGPLREADRRVREALDAARQHHPSIEATPSPRTSAPRRTQSHGRPRISWRGSQHGGLRHPPPSPTTSGSRPAPATAAWTSSRPGGEPRSSGWRRSRSGRRWTSRDSTPTRIWSGATPRPCP
jgi:hypothetical protein